MLKRILTVSTVFLFLSAGMAAADAGHVTKTESGLQYEDLVEGEGTLVLADSKVAVHYVGWLEDGTKFDSSLDRGQPFIFTLGAGQVIKGWEEGMEGMQVGGQRKLVIPPNLGYGAAGFKNQETGAIIIPPNATLIFQIQVIGVR